MRAGSRASSKTGHRKSTLTAKRGSTIKCRLPSKEVLPLHLEIPEIAAPAPAPPEITWADKRKAYEDESREQCLIQVREVSKKRGFDESQKAKLLQMMRDQGDGSVRIAWRRHFDQDGDGDLSFKEFCNGLAKIGYIGDVISLWRELGGEADNCITLQAVDFSGAEIVGYFSTWCQVTFSGPFEFFTALDDDGSNSLTAEEFSDGLVQYGFFDAPDIPARIATKELALENLFPFLDAAGQGSIACQDVFFLERDKDKRDEIKFQFLQKEMLDKYGEELMNPLPRSAEEMLKKAGPELFFAAFNEELPEHRRPGSAPNQRRPASTGAASRLPLLSHSCRNTPQSGKPTRPASGTRLARTR